MPVQPVQRRLQYEGATASSSSSAAQPAAGSMSPTRPTRTKRARTPEPAEVGSPSKSSRGKSNVHQQQQQQQQQQPGALPRGVTDLLMLAGADGGDDLGTEHQSEEAQAAQRRLQLFLDQPLVSMWCRFEWFSSSIDAAALGEDEFTKWMVQNNIPLGPRTRAQWHVVRKPLFTGRNKTRRFSAKFVQHEREKLKLLRSKISLLQKTNGVLPVIDTIPEVELPQELPAALSVGDRVIARVPPVKKPETPLETLVAKSGGFVEGVVVLVEPAQEQYRVWFSKIKQSVTLSQEDVMLVNRPKTLNVQSAQEAAMELMMMQQRSAAASSSIAGSYSKGLHSQHARIHDILADSKFKLTLSPKSAASSPLRRPPSAGSSPHAAPLSAPSTPGASSSSSTAPAPVGKTMSVRERVLAIVRELSQRQLPLSANHDIMAMLETDASAPADPSDIPNSKQHADVVHDMLLLLRLLRIKEFLLQHLNELNVQAETTYARASENAEWRWDEQTQQQYAWIVMLMDSINTVLAPSIVAIRHRIQVVISDAYGNSATDADSSSAPNSAASTSSAAAMNALADGWASLQAAYQQATAIFAHSREKPVVFQNNDAAEGLALLAKVSGIASTPTELTGLNNGPVNGHSTALNGDASLAAPTPAAAPAPAKPEEAPIDPKTAEARERSEKLIVNCISLMAQIQSCVDLKINPATEPIEIELLLETALAGVAPVSGNLDSSSIFHKIGDVVNQIKVMATGASLPAFTSP